MNPVKPPSDRSGARPHAHIIGWLDLLGHTVKETAPRIRRMHTQIADTVFGQIERIPPAQPVVNITRTLHHLIAGLSYNSVAGAGAGVSYLARLHFRPLQTDGKAQPGPLQSKGEDSA